jgi:two-component system, response regulator PdtaR
MGLSEMQQRILTPFVGETIKTLSEMAGLNAYAGDGFEDSMDKFKFKGYAIAAETFGVIEGKMLMHLYIETAIAIGNKVRARVLGEMDEASSVTEDIGETLAEFGNTAIGLATRQLEKTMLGIKFKPPYFILNTEQMDTMMQGVREILSVPIHVEGVGRFYFNYLLHGQTEAA